MSQSESDLAVNRLILERQELRELISRQSDTIETLIKVIAQELDNPGSVDWEKLYATMENRF